MPHTVAMLKVELLISLGGFALWLFCLIDVVGTDTGRVRNLPKLWWLLIVLFFPFIGSIAWLVAGRPEGRAAGHHGRPDFPEYDRPGRFAATDDSLDEEFLRGVRERAEEQRRRYDAERRKKQQPDDDSA